VTPRQKRGLLIIGVLAVAAAIVALVLRAFQSNLVFFYTPTQILANEAPKNRTFRVGGMVQKGSLQRDGVKVRFIVTDTQKSITVHYQGLLPDLFKEGKGVVAQGRLDERGSFTAAEVLAKHDENYMPPEAAEAIRKAAPGRPRAGDQ
jgi:cytochrome c-type biogenesis protein CcmE